MKTKYIQNAQTQFLRDTIRFYNSKNRAEFEGCCVYHPTEYSPGCAIGRHLPESLTTHLYGSVYSVHRDSPGVLGAMLVLGVEFLTGVQALHDVSVNWDSNGLSPCGVRAVDKLCCCYCLNLQEVLSKP